MSAVAIFTKNLVALWNVYSNVKMTIFKPLPPDKLFPSLERLYELDYTTTCFCYWICNTYVIMGLISPDIF